MNNRLLKEVKDYWEKTPIFDYEIKEEKFTKTYFDKVDEITLKDNISFNLHFFNFKDTKSKRVLDIGCGAGFLVREYSRRGARITGVDITEISVKRTLKSLELFGLKGNVLQANAEQLPFKNDNFDMVTSWGVLHHISSTEKGVDEIYRVLKPGGTGIISLYYKNYFLLNRLMFPIMLFFLRLLLDTPKERSGLQYARTPQEFVRMYDGAGNPIGRSYTRKEVKRLFKSFKIIRVEQHGIPKRFLKGFDTLPRTIHRMADSLFGICLCIEVRK